MRVNYQPILYARNVRQCVRIAAMDKEVLRTGVRARATFEFMYRPEFLQIGTKVLFTEGKTKAIGTIKARPPARAPRLPAARASHRGTTRCRNSSPRSRLAPAGTAPPRERRAG